MKKKPIHFLEKQSITACGCFLFSGGVLAENTTKDKTKVTCQNCKPSLRQPTEGKES